MRLSPWPRRVQPTRGKLCVWVFALGFGIGAPPAWAGYLPAFREVKEAFRSSEGRLLDRRGELLQERRLDAHGRRLRWTALGEVSPALVRAVLAVEDQRFFDHGGVDFRALARAAWVDLRGARQGASTISMQTVALLDRELGARRGRERGLWQKVRQMRLAWELEKAWRKEEILEAYLNLVTFRGEQQGVAAAARALFDKDPHGMGLQESFLLAALLKSPGAAATAVGERLCALAGEIPELGACKELNQLAVRALGVRPRLRREVELAPHLAKRLLNAPSELRTSLDAGLQRVVLNAVEDQMRQLSAQNVRDAAALVVENQTGRVLAYVGSSGHWSASPEVDMVRSPRQAGSTLKPFLYGLAFARTYLKPGSWLLDAPFELPAGRGTYRPENYDHEFRGPVRASVALASSLNIPAVRVIDLVGVEAFRDELEALGIGGLGPAEFYGPSLALGSADVTLEQLVGAYAALANHGRTRAFSFGAKVAAPLGRRALPVAAADAVTAILADRDARSATFGLDSTLSTPYSAAVKTGTSKDMRDNWCLGFTRDYTVGVWVGNASGEPMWQVSGVEGAAPIWRAAMDYLRRSRHPLPLPELSPETEKYAGGAFGRILYPEQGALIALDPDIPAGRQRIPLEADAGGAFTVDGQKVEGSVWEPRRGKHRIALLGPEGQELDAVAVEVR